uniref:Cryptochrome 1 n=1 Tax=Tetraselmis sp. GSL018 TaxID=582737 RepID=A0A061S2Y5_9CHLO
MWPGHGSKASQEAARCEDGGNGFLSVTARLSSAPKFDTSILWFRRDLRVDDNPALIAAIKSSSRVIPVYIFAPEEEGQFQPGRSSRWWLQHSLEALSQDLQMLGSRLILRRGTESVQELQNIIQETGATALFYNHLYDPISLVRDNEVKAELLTNRIQCYSFNSEVLYEPWEVTDKNGGAFTTFAEFWDRVTHMPYPPQPLLSVPPCLPTVPLDLRSAPMEEMGLMSEEEEMSSEHLKFKWTVGSMGAMEKFDSFLGSKMKQFDRDRAKTDRESTSKLSPHIHFGEISVRRMHYMVKQLEWKWAASKEGGTSCADFLRQMGYREYGRYLSFHFPFTHERSLLEHLRACPWNFDQSLFKAWRQGTTGYPLVDAGMLELWSTGWLHNRLRVVCASFLVKNLLLPWQWGLKHFWDNLLDADVESDALGFQYVSGCLLDAHPFSYMHNLEIEARRFDPSGNYVRRWLPVLSRLPSKYIHCPSEAPPALLQDAGVELGTNYPYPIVSIEKSRRQVQYACEVIAKCCRDPPKYRKEPYYPPSDPKLAVHANLSPILDQGDSICNSQDVPQLPLDFCDESENVASNCVGAEELQAVPEVSRTGSVTPGSVERKSRQHMMAEDDAEQAPAGRSGGSRECRDNTNTGTETGTSLYLAGGLQHDQSVRPATGGPGSGPWEEAGDTSGSCDRRSPRASSGEPSTKQRKLSYPE